MNSKDKNQKLSKIVLLGVSCVGKSTLGRIIAEKLGYEFLESDQELIKRYGSILKFQNQHFTVSSRMKQKAIIFSSILSSKNNIVLDVSPIFSKTAIKKIVSGKNILPIYLYDTPENLFKRITFTDDNDQIIEVEPEYLVKHRHRYINQFKGESLQMGRDCKDYCLFFDVQGRSILDASEALFNFIKKNM